MTKGWDRLGERKPHRVVCAWPYVVESEPGNTLAEGKPCTKCQKRVLAYTQVEILSVKAGLQHEATRQHGRQI